MGGGKLASGNFTDVIFPVLSVKILGRDAFYGAVIKAVDIDAIAIRMGAGNIKRLHPARLTKQMLCNMGIEAV